MVIRNCGWLCPESLPQAHITADILALLESALIVDSEYECQSDQRPDAGDLLQDCRFRTGYQGDRIHQASNTGLGV